MTIILFFSPTTLKNTIFHDFRPSICVKYTRKRPKIPSRPHYRGLTISLGHAMLRSGKTSVSAGVIPQRKTAGERVEATLALAAATSQVTHAAHDVHRCPPKQNTPGAARERRTTFTEACRVCASKLSCLMCAAVSRAPQNQTEQKKGRLRVSSFVSPMASFDPLLIQRKFGGTTVCCKQSSLQTSVEIRRGSKLAMGLVFCIKDSFQPTIQ